MFHGKNEWWRITSEAILRKRRTERSLSSGHISTHLLDSTSCCSFAGKSLQSVTFVTVAIISGEPPVSIITVLDTLHIICTLHNNTDRRYYYSHFINNETGQWYSGKPALQKKRKKEFVEFVKFRGVSSPTVPGSRDPALTTGSHSSWIRNNPGCGTPFKQGGAHLGDSATSPDPMTRKNLSEYSPWGLRTPKLGLLTSTLLHTPCLFLPWTLPVPIFIPPKTRNLVRVQLLLEPFLTILVASFSLSYYIYILAFTPVWYINIY